MNPRTHMVSDFWAIVSLATGVANWQLQLDWGLRILATLVGIAAGLVAIWQRFKKPPPEAS